MNYEAFSFGTLWQEATRAVGYTWASITDIIGLSEEGKTARRKLSEAGHTARFESLLNSSNGRNITTILFVVTAVAIVYFAMQKKK